ncbi:MAG TPA: TIGR04282 family arsenosugar biosynthesis glycosyltransferase [Ktedonobacterales bacterium]|jgi:hypothetical protein
MSEGMGAGARRALAIVAKYPTPGVAKTRLAARIGPRAAAELYRAFLGDLAARFTRAAARDGYRLVWARAPGPGDLREVVGAGACVPLQRGEDFATRLYHVCEDLRAAGYGDIVVSSSDSPHLPARWVRQAFAAIGDTRIALGPAEDGGYYLIGLRATSEVPDLFRGIAMSTERVYAETVARAGALGLDVTRLPATFDVDEVADLERLATALARPGATAAASPRTLAALRRLGLAARHPYGMVGRAGPAMVPPR